MLGELFTVDLARLMQAHEVRRQQSDMAEAVYAALTDASKLIVEAPTGVGKSLGYLVPALLYQKRASPYCRIIIATYTKTLQEQLLHRDIPLASACVDTRCGTATTSCAAFGSENYLCIVRHDEWRRSLHLDDAERADAALLDGWLRVTTTGRADEIRVRSETWQEINRQSDLCRGRHCTRQRECYYFRMLDAVRTSDVVVVNHHLYFAHIASGGRLLPARSRDVEDIVVFDEAHNLPEVAMQWLGADLSNTQVRHLARQLHNPHSRRGLLGKLSSLDVAWHRRLMESVSALHAAEGQFFSELLAAYAGRDEVRIQEPPAVEDVLSPVLDILHRQLANGANRADSDEEQFLLRSFANRVLNQTAMVRLWLRCSDPAYVFWLEREKRARGVRVTLHATPLDITRDLQDKVYVPVKRIIFTSATLDAGDGCGYFKRSAGLEPVITPFGTCKRMILPTPFNYRENVLLFLPRDVPDPREDALYRASCTAYIRDLVRATGGDAFVLFTSVDMMRAVHGELAADPRLQGYELIEQKGSAAQVLQRYRETDRAVLFGVDTFWQGIDIPGEKLVSIIIPRLPFEVPDHPVNQALTERIRHEGGDPFRDYSLPNAIIKLKQGFGRLIRRRTDWGVVSILDPRLRTRWYGRHFLRALPQCTETRHLDDVRTFVQRRRSRAVAPRETP